MVGYAGLEKNLDEFKSSAGKQTSRVLRIAALNVVSLHRHFCEVEHVINEHKHKILALSETRLCEDIKDPEVGLEGF